MTVNNKLAYPFYIMLHPFDGYEELKYRKADSVPLSFAILVLFFLVSVISALSTGFLFNPDLRTENVNILNELAKVMFIFAFWTIANWALCTLMEGEGSFREIWVASAYALMPVVLATVLLTILSNFLTLREKPFMDMITSISRYWAVFLMIIAMKTVHQYTVKKTLTSMFFSILGMVFIFFLLTLAYSLFQQLFIFLRTVYSEILYRF